MKKRIFPLILVVLVLFLALRLVGGNSNMLTSTDSATSAVVQETRVIRWNSGTSGNVLLTIAEEKGYFEEYGLTIEKVNATAVSSAMTLLATGQVDIVSNAGTSNPLQQIAAGVDMTIFGGNMVTGGMPIVAKAGTVWNGPQDLIGKKFACNPSYFALTGAVMDLGYDKPLEALEWVLFTNYSDALAAVVRGEVDYALLGTEMNYTVNNMDEVDIMCFQSDIMPNYSCCRVESTTEFLENNPITIKLVLKALIRAQQYYEGHKEEAIKLHAAVIGAEEDYVAAYMLDEHYRVSVDPLKNSVVRAWGILDTTDFLDENAKSIDILDHINTELYEAALNEVIAEHGKEDPEFYDKMRTFYKENNI